MVRLSAGRLGRTLEEQALCFLAGANSIHAGEKLLTRPNPDFEGDGRCCRFLAHPAPAFGMMEGRLAKEKRGGAFPLSSTTRGLIDLTSNDYFGFARELMRSLGRQERGRIAPSHRQFPIL